MSKTIYFVAGEVSGDNHGAGLMRALRQLQPDMRFVGRGGPQMANIAGSDFHDWIADAAVVGLWEVIRNYGYFRQKFGETIREIRAEKPDAVILIDYPGFNLRLARTLRRQKAARKIIYYISPQVWAWNRGRIKQMARWLDLMLCIFPFEAELYNKSGLRTIFVGHPMIERLSKQKSDVQRDRNLVALFPGSRRREVKKIFPVLLHTVTELIREKPDLRFEVAAASDRIAGELEEILNRSAFLTIRPRINIVVENSASIMQRAFVGIVASGSATQEAAYFRLPFVLIYKVSWPTYLAGRVVINVDYLGMPNVLAGREVVPEFIQHQAHPVKISKAVLRLIDDPAARHEMISAFNDVVATLGQGGASEQAARAIVNELSEEKL